MLPDRLLMIGMIRKRLFEGKAQGGMHRVGVVRPHVYIEEHPALNVKASSHPLFPVNKLAQ